MYNPVFSIHQKLQTSNGFTLFCSVDSGHLVHRPLRASGCGEHHLSGGILCAASLSFPGTRVCQALKNTLELAPESQADLPSLTSPEDPSLPSQQIVEHM